MVEPSRLRAALQAAGLQPTPAELAEMEPLQPVMRTLSEMLDVAAARQAGQSALKFQVAPVEQAHVERPSGRREASRQTSW